MKKLDMFLASVVVLLLMSFSFPVNGALTVPPPDQPGPYHIGSYKVSYLVPAYGVYQATIRYPATTDGVRQSISLEHPIQGL